jgi:hypothetical protein
MPPNEGGAKQVHFRPIPGRPPPLYWSNEIPFAIR